MKTKKEIIHLMCLTYRNDYTLLNETEKNIVFEIMSKIFDTTIEPHMEFKKDPLDEFWKNAEQYSE